MEELSASSLLDLVLAVRNFGVLNNWFRDLSILWVASSGDDIISIKPFFPLYSLIPTWKFDDILPSFCVTNSKTWTIDCTCEFGGKPERLGPMCSYIRVFFELVSCSERSY